MSDTINIANLREWIGREEIVTDQLSTGLVDKFRATIGFPGDTARQGDVAPRLIHFCLCQPATPIDALGHDGHPARGSFLPPVQLPRRMWAGSDIEFSGDLRAGETVTRRSTVSDVISKAGRSGPLCFVTVNHEISGSQSVVVRDRQTLVYQPLKRSSPAGTAESAPAGYSSVTIRPTSTLLFRYSALTFNGHRIHYDQPYATEQEGYPGLVVHGPLQATLLYHLAAMTNEGIPPNRFDFRSLSTLFDTEEFRLHTGQFTEGELHLWTARANGPTAMQARALWT